MNAQLYLTFISAPTESLVCAALFELT